MEANLQHAQPPFDNRHADLILQSKDGVIFRVFKVILTQASSVFADTLSVPHPPPEAAQQGDYIDGDPVLRLEESSRTVDLFLRCSYPVARPPLDMSDICELYGAGLKYDAAGVVQYASQELSRFSVERDSCLRAYVIACRLKLHDQAISAARQSLKLPLQSVTLMEPRFPELAMSSILVLTNLLDYQKKCRVAVSDELLSPEYWLPDGSWHPAVFEDMDRDVECCADGDGIFPDTYYHYDDEDQCHTPYQVYLRAKLWMSDLFDEFRRNLLSGELSLYGALADTKVLDDALGKAVQCDQCRTRAIPILTECVREIERKAPIMVLKVCIHLSSPRYRPWPVKQFSSLGATQYRGINLDSQSLFGPEALWI